ncbi:hypothetical protein AJ79_08064 [Helicocarpus griseus UAMH5409]|uniref:Protein YAE1 n=1 Tax=Helicocarpus griseus UAMH5409 TaxID=1447875 RepID=A0A2B7WWD9_9EURO|nr:hypothetical protein AJ79_08064 [Helicocarpus griseus UAMH5409]
MPSVTSSPSGSQSSHNSPPTPPSPASVHQLEDHQPNTASSLDDIFGSSPPAATIPHHPPTQEPSDLPSLRRQHVTAGYRDGVSVAKNEHVQRGFDEGFPVGAELGLRIGIVLGVLEGLARAGAGGSGNASAVKGEGEDVQALFERAKKELAVQSVFGAVAADVGVDAAERTGGEWEDPCVRLGRAGEEVVARWEGRVEGLLGGRS